MDEIIMIVGADAAMSDIAQRIGIQPCVTYQYVNRGVLPEVTLLSPSKKKYGRFTPPKKKRKKK